MHYYEFVIEQKNIPFDRFILRAYTLTHVYTHTHTPTLGLFFYQLMRIMGCNVHIDGIHIKNIMYFDSNDNSINIDTNISPARDIIKKHASI